MSGSDSDLNDALKQLRKLSARLLSLRREGWGDEASRLDVDKRDDGLHVHWLLNEDADEAIFQEVFRGLAEPKIAPWLASLTLEGHQIASNGTIDWEVNPIAYAKSLFRRLKVLRIESAGATDQPYSNGRLIGRDWGDPSVATRLLTRMPALEELSIPEPPRDEAFFHGPSHPLKKLQVFNTDYDFFIARLSTSDRFPALEKVRFVESFRTDASHRLPFSPYLSLFESTSFPSLSVLTIEQAGLSEDHLRILRNTMMARQLSHLSVKPATSWCDRPILHAPEDFGLAAPPRGSGVSDDECVYLVGELQLRFLGPLQDAIASFNVTFPDVRMVASSTPFREGERIVSLVIALRCIIPARSKRKSHEVKLQLCFDNLGPHSPTAQAKVVWDEIDHAEFDLFPGTVTMTEEALNFLSSELPRLVQKLGTAVRRGKPRNGQ